MKGIDAMVIAYLRENPKSNANTIALGTGCTFVSVRSALYRLMKEGKLDTEPARTRRLVYNYSLKFDVDLDELCDIDVCGKHYSLTGEQIRRLRGMADGYEDINRGIRNGKKEED